MTTRAASSVEATGAVQYSRCLEAHPYWLSCINQLVVPPADLGGLEPSVRELAQSGRTFLKQGQPAEAIAVLEEAARRIGERLDPSASYVKFLLGCALSYLGQQEYARSRMEQAVRGAPRVGSYHLGLGMVALRNRDPDEAVACFRRAVALDPALGVAWAALAVIHALCRQHPETETAARRARQLGATIGNDLVGLALMQATYCQGKPVEGALDFSSLAERASERIDEALRFLPPVDPAQFRQGQPAGLTVFIYADHEYFVEHALPLVWSIAERSPACAVHTHVANPEPALDGSIERLRASVPHLRWTVSTEQVDLARYGPASLYHSCVRFCRLHQFLAVHAGPVVILDADMLVRGEVSRLAESAAPVGLTRYPAEPIWDEFLGGCVYFGPAPESRAFLAQAALFIADNLQKGRGRWFLDQVALQACYRKFNGSMPIAVFSHETVCDLRHGPDSLVWTVTLSKEAEGPFSAYKDALKARYGHALEPSPHR